MLFAAEDLDHVKSELPVSFHPMLLQRAPLTLKERPCCCWEALIFARICSSLQKLQIGGGEICRRQVTSEASSCQESHSFAASKLLTSLGSFGEQSPGLSTSKQCCKGNQVQQHRVCAVIGSSGFTHASTHVPALNQL